MELGGNEMGIKEENKEIWEHDYSDLVEEDGRKILIQVDENGYSGDSLFLIHDIKQDEYGYLCVGWGSCSGCDALQACKNAKELRELQQEIVNNIIWKSNKKDIYNFIMNKDYEGEFINNNLYLEFIDKLSNWRLEWK